MVRLTSNEEKVRKELIKFPNGARASQVMKQVFMTKTPLYVALKSLEEKNLAFRGGHYLWYPDSIELKNRSVNKLNLEHSRLLIPALDKVILCSFDTQNQLFRALKEHLNNGYPEIYQKLNILLDLMTKENENLLQKHSQEINNLKSGFSNYEYHPFQLLRFLSYWNPILNHLELRDRMVREVKPLLEIFSSLSDDLSLLRLKIEHGTPLEGCCELCPSV